MAEILMPKATAVWLVDNTSLSFEQIADFCGLHPLEVKGIADGEVARDIRGADPIANGQLSREELDKAQADENYRMKALVSRHADLFAKSTQKKGPRYTPVSRRQDRPDAIAWFIRHHPEVADAQIAKLLGTTKATIESVRGRTHWNAANLKPVDPVTLGLVSQLELDDVVRKAAEKKAKEDARTGGATLRPAAESTSVFGEEESPASEPEDAGDEW
ncbi:cell cycle transcriptional regulator TrcR [Caulobacter sp. 17J80-11]|uniref:DUF1013 domain-containing protein n=1 Tax=Caulobacter sp. 17J80-11 TaxID=2763502 RepID=UPI001653D6BF|nr:DUF1013 domain-containing protein [Caulobacter sp. 17J80-11]